jgi:hypothetical protein
MAQDILSMSPQAMTVPGRSFTLITPGATAFAPTRALYIATGGTANLTDVEGHDEDNVPVTTGTQIPGQFIKVRAVSGAVIYAMR